MRDRIGRVAVLLATLAGCTGKDGLSVLVTSEPAGENCPAGGARVQVGDAAPTYVCNGASGADGQSAVVSTEPAGANCAAGGVKVQVGGGPVTYVCNGAAGAAGASAPTVAISAEPPGPSCASGGVRIQIGSGAPAYVCNGAAGADGSSCTIETVAGITTLTCTDGTSTVLSRTLSVGGEVTGLLAGGLVLAIETTSTYATLGVDLDGPYGFHGFAEGDLFEVWVDTAPPTLACTVSNPSGALGAASVTGVDVQCACREGLANCDADPANGCETDVTTSDDCGGCGIACASDQVCLVGSCGPAVLSFQVDGGQFVEDPPPAYSCLEACALLFGGTEASWSCSTDRDTVNHLGWYTGWGDGTHCGPDGEALAEDTKPADHYVYGAFSAYLSDWCIGASSTNYCFPRVE